MLVSKSLVLVRTTGRKVIRFVRNYKVEKEVNLLCVVESSLQSRVEELDQVMALHQFRFFIIIFFGKCKKVLRGDISLSRLVDSLECSVGLKRTCFAEILPRKLDLHFSLSNVDEQSCKSLLCVD